MRRAAKERLMSLLGDNLANKLINDMHQAATQLGDLLLQDIRTSAKNRMSLMLDELTNVNDQKLEEVKQLLELGYGDYLSCEVIKLSATSSLLSGEKMSEYIGHAAMHYEHAVEAMVKSSVVAGLEAKHADVVRNEAHNRTGENN